MNLESQVCSFELAKRLKELGVKQDSLFWFVKWIPPKGCSYYSSTNDWKLSIYKGSTDDQEIISAFTVAELGYILSDLYNKCNGTNYNIEHEANNRAKTIISLIEEGYFKV